MGVEFNGFREALKDLHGIFNHQYSHILDENRKVNARLIEDAIYQKESAEIHLKAEVKENEPQVNQSDADAAEAMKKLATNPELMQLLIKLSKSM